MSTFSFWEQQTLNSKWDYLIVGSGIVGMSAALTLRDKYPQSKILILEKGYFPEGASTKNAGFACFGSLSELRDDLKNSTMDEVMNLAYKRLHGLEKLRGRIGDGSMEYQPLGSYDLYREQDESRFENDMKYMDEFNRLFHSKFKANTFHLADHKIKEFGFNKIRHLIFNAFEGQIDTGKMMKKLRYLVLKKDIEVYNSTSVTSFEEQSNRVLVETNQDITFSTDNLLFASNGFAHLLTQQPVQPARAQVLITKEIASLKVRGTFHYDCGFYYFRNVGNRVLLGGGRNLDLEGERTYNFGLTDEIQQALEDLLREVILPQTKIEIDQRWSGIMGVGESKAPIVKKLSERVSCGVRMGGMGIAIGSLIGEELAELMT